MLIKICGLTNKDDVHAAVECGIECVGFILYPKSPRYVCPEKLVELTGIVPERVKKVGVFVNSAIDEIRETAHSAGLDIIQYHGDGDAGFIANVGLKAWKALGLRSGDDIAAAAAFPGVEHVLVDAVSTEERGGTGKVCDWHLAFMLARKRSIILAGGLTPDNVASAIRQVRPFGIDVSSGVEKLPGQKDHLKLRRFVEAARRAAADLCKKEMK